MSSDQSTVGRAGDDRANERPDVDDLQVELELLREQNRRLREDRRRTLQARYRRSALGLAGLGAVALAGAALFPGTRDVLFALAGVGLFSGVLVYYLTPERFIAATVGEAVYDAYATTSAGLLGDLGLTDHRVYVPTCAGARLFVPQHESYEVPDDGDLDDTVVVTDDERRRGVTVQPSGAGLSREFERTLTGGPTDDPSLLAEQLADALVEAFELADGAQTDVEPGRLTVRVSGPAYGSVDSFDHPVASFVGVGAATAMDVPVELDVSDGDDDRVDALVTARWEADPESG